jgi:hypothetical protein
MSFNLATILAETALATPDAPVNIFSDVTTTYRDSMSSPACSRRG